MTDMLEIRWHGRGGQGAKTASLLLGEACLGEGRHIQAFSEYGPERMGAPVQSFNRVSDARIRLRCNVTAPQVVVVLDDSLIGPVDVTEGLPAGGKIIVNTAVSAAEMRRRVKLTDGVVFSVDASRIAKETIKRDIPNTPMLGALARVTGILKLESLLEDTRKRLEKKFASKPEVITGNLQAMERGYQEVTHE